MSKTNNNNNNNNSVFFLKKKLAIPSVGKDVKQLEFSYISSGDTKWNSHHGKYFGSFL